MDRKAHDGSRAGGDVRISRILGSKRMMKFNA